jgi:predicted nucleic acid-binding protein
MRCMTQDEAETRAIAITAKYDKLKVSDRIARFIAKQSAEARHFNVGVQVLQFHYAKHLRPKYIMQGDLL